MGQASGNIPRTKGQFVVGFVTAVSEISAAFENQIQNILAENGIEDPQLEETYPMDAVVSSINQMAENVGPKMTHRIGVYQVTIPEWPDEVDTVEKGCAACDDMYRDAYENFDPDELGQFRFEKTGEKEGRAAVTEEFPYPPAFASGIYDGVLQEFTPDGTLTDIEETDPADDEKAAFELRW